MHAYSYSVNQAYDYVKKKRPIISPNLNFMGQLMAYQKRRNASDCSNSDDSSSPEYGNDRHSAVEMDCSSSTPVSSNGAFDFNSAAITCK